MASVVRARGQQSDTAQRRDLPALTGLRAVAAVWVVLLHLQVASGPYLDKVPLLRPVIGAGWTGVELFFVLSGFVLTWNYAQRLSRPTPGAVAHFVFARFARIWPAWAAATTLAGVWLWCTRSAGQDADVLTPHPPSGAWELLRQLSMTQQWGVAELGGAAFIPPGWSVSAEWAAYLVFPVVALGLPLLRRLPGPVLLAAAVAALMPLAVLAFREGVPDTEQDWLPRIVCGFGAGVLTALAVRRLQWLPLGHPAGLVMCWTAVSAIVTGAAWAAWVTWTEGAVEDPADHYGVVVVAFPLLVAGLALSDRGPARWLGSAPMGYAGRVSYCLYLVHFPVIEAVLGVWWDDTSDIGVLTPGLVLSVPGIVALAVVLAVALHHGVEEPARKRLLALTKGRSSTSVDWAGRAGSTPVDARAAGTEADRVAPRRLRSQTRQPQHVTVQLDMGRPVSAARLGLGSPVRHRGVEVTSPVPYESAVQEPTVGGRA